MSELPVDVVATTPGHVAAHEVLHAAHGGLPTGLTAAASRQSGGGSRGHLAAHAALKTWYDAANPGNPLPAVVDAASHIAAHEALHAWVNSAGWPPEGVTFTNVPTYRTGGFGGSYFPTGVWLESIAEVADRTTDEGAGLNLYAGMTGGSDLTIATANGAKVLPQWAMTGNWPNPSLEWANNAAMTNPGTSVATGWNIFDELDMFGGTVAENHAYLDSIEATLASRGDTRIRYINWGKGVAFWNTDADAASYITRADIASVDTYFYTDPNIHGAWEGAVLLGQAGTALTDAQTRLACNYARMVERMYYLCGLASVSKPIWNFIEVGRPASETVAEGSLTMTPDHIRGAVWHSVIAGAIGIVYFNHSFSEEGTFTYSAHCLRDAAYATQRAAVTEVNTRLHALANVIHSPTASGYVTTPSTVRTLVKHYNGYWYIFAGSKDGTTGSRTFSGLADYTGSTVEVLYESRNLTISGGSFTDTISQEWETHIYRIPATQ